MTTVNAQDMTMYANAFAGFDNKSKEDVKKTKQEAFPYFGEVLIENAIINMGDGGSCLKLRVFLKDRGMSYDIEPMYYRGRNNEVSNKHQKEYDKMMNLLYITNPAKPDKSPATPPVLMPAKHIWNKETKKFDDNVPQMQMPELVGKIFTGVVVCIEKFDSMIINGYTRELIPAYNEEGFKEAKNSPESIYIDNENKTKPMFYLWGWGTLNTKQTLSEIIEGSEAVELEMTYKSACEKRDKGEFSPQVVLDRAGDIKEKLLKRLANSNIAFDANRYNMYLQMPIPGTKIADGSSNTNNSVPNATPATQSKAPF